MGVGVCVGRMRRWERGEDRMREQDSEENKEEVRESKCVCTKC